MNVGSSAERIHAVLELGICARGGKIQDLVQPYLERLDELSKRPEDSRPVTLLHLAFPTPTSDQNNRRDPVS